MGVPPYHCQCTILLRRFSRRGGRGKADYVGRKDKTHGVCFKVHLLDSVLLPEIQYGCELWGMHSPGAASANNARTALQCMYAQQLWVDCGV